MNARITIEVGNETVYRNYALSDGQIPESAKEGLQDMLDTIKLSNGLEAPQEILLKGMREKEKGGEYEVSMETMMDDEGPREVEWGVSEKDGFEAFSNY